MSGADDPLTDGLVTLRPIEHDEDPQHLRFTVELEGATVGEVSLLLLEDLVGQLTWRTEPQRRRQGVATRAVRLLTQHALGAQGLARVQAYVDPGDVASLRIAGRSGLRREGVLRGLRPQSGSDRDQGDRDQGDRVGGWDRSQGDRGPREEGDRGGRGDLVVFARLAEDPGPHEPEGFRALMNAGLPRKRVIAQLAVRDHDGRLLLCQLTYKQDWDLPGGVVEVGESPRLAASREVQEELALDVPAGDLLLVDWLPPWSGWEDACTLVFDGGTHSADLTDAVVREQREIRSAQFCDPDQIRARCAPQTTRRALAALAAAAAPGARYLESGTEPGR